MQKINAKIDIDYLKMDYRNAVRIFRGLEAVPKYPHDEKLIEALKTAERHMVYLRYCLNCLGIEPKDTKEINSKFERVNKFGEIEEYPVPDISFKGR